MNLNRNPFAFDSLYKMTRLLGFRHGRTEVSFQAFFQAKYRLQLRYYMIFRLFQIISLYFLLECHIESLDGQCRYRPALILSMLFVLVFFICESKNPVPSSSKFARQVLIFGISLFPYLGLMTFLGNVQCFTILLTIDLYIIAIFTLFSWKAFSVLLFGHFTLFYNFLVLTDEELAKDFKDDLYGVFGLLALSILIFALKELSLRKSWIILDSFNKTQAFFASLFEGIPLPAFITDPELTILWANKHSEEFISGILSPPETESLDFPHFLEILIENEDLGNLKSIIATASNERVVINKDFLRRKRPNALECQAAEGGLSFIGITVSQILHKGEKALLFSFDEKRDFESQARINGLFSEKLHGKMKKVIKKYHKVGSSEIMESFTKFRAQEKGDEEPPRKDFYGQNLNVLKIHTFMNLQLHRYFLGNSPSKAGDSINLRFFLLGIFESVIEFQKECQKGGNVIRFLDFQCQISCPEPFDTTLYSDFKTLEHIFLVLFFSLLARNLLDDFLVKCEFLPAANKTQFSLNFIKNKSLIQGKQPLANEVALFLTDKIFELSNLSEEAFFIKFSENLRLYKIFDICLTMLLFSLEQLKAEGFQIEDLSSEEQIITSVSFSLKIGRRPNKPSLLKDFCEIEGEFAKSNHLRFVQRVDKRSNRAVFVLENALKRGSSRNSIDLNGNMVFSCEIPENRARCPISPSYLESSSRRKISEEICMDKSKSPEEEMVLSEKRLRYCPQVLGVSLRLRAEDQEGKKPVGAEEKLSLRELIATVLERNIKDFEKEYATVLKTVFSELNAGQGELSRELIEQELEKMGGKEQPFKGSIEKLSSLNKRPIFPENSPKKTFFPESFRLQRQHHSIPNLEVLHEKAAASKSQFGFPLKQEETKQMEEMLPLEAESKESLVFEDASLESEKDIISKLIIKSQSTRSSPNTLNVDPKPRSNRTFTRFAVSPMSQPMNSSSLMKRLESIKNDEIPAFQKFLRKPEVIK